MRYCDKKGDLIFPGDTLLSPSDTVYKAILIIGLSDVPQMWIKNYNLSLFEKLYEDVAANMEIIQYEEKEKK